MSNVWDYINSILTNKTNMMRKSENDKLAEDGYNPWLTNNALSYHEDTVLIANFIYMYSQLSKRPQYEFLLNAVRPKKRQFKKWVKQVSDEDLNAVCLTYSCNRILGKEYAQLLTLDQLKSIRDSRLVGGSQKDK